MSDQKTQQIRHIGSQLDATQPRPFRLFASLTTFLDPEQITGSSPRPTLASGRSTPMGAEGEAEIERAEAEMLDISTRLASTATAQLSETEKAPYEARASKAKADYETCIATSEGAAALAAYKNARAAVAYKEKVVSKKRRSAVAGQGLPREAL